MGFLDKLQDAVLDKIKDIPGGFNPEVFEDEIALKTRWNPLVGGGSNFASRKLEKVSSSYLEYKPKLMAKLFPSFFIIAGLGAAIIPTVANGFELILSLSTIFGGLVFSGIGYLIYHLMTKPIVFDIDKGIYYKGDSSENNIKNRCEIKDIHAIQLISEYVSGDESSYTSIEVNLVLKNASRLNVIDQGGNIEDTIIEAEQLADFLDVPLWNAIR